MARSTISRVGGQWSTEEMKIIARVGAGCGRIDAKNPSWSVLSRTSSLSLSLSLENLVFCPSWVNSRPVISNISPGPESVNEGKA